MARDARAVIIGLDGVPFGMVKNFAESGVMPNTAKLIEEGVFRRMESSIPEVSSTAWSSMITGTQPGEHGIYGFTDLRPNSCSMYFPNYNDLKVAPFWEGVEGESVIINVPSTYPVRSMNGSHISGFVSIDFNKSVYPQSLVEKLKEMDYRLDVDAALAHKSMDEFLDDVDATLDARSKSWRYLWCNCCWKRFMVVFTGTDRLMHFLWCAYEDLNHKYHSAFEDHFRKIDVEIGEIASRVGDDDILVIHSDHGFERLDYDVYLNRFLAVEGLLAFKDNTDPSLENLSSETKVFVLDPSRIYLNVKGKYPCGSVEAGHVEELMQKLQKLFANFQIDGRQVIRSIYRKKDLYSGPQLENAPDMVLVPAEGFNLKGAIRAPEVYSKGIFTGKHTQDTAFLIVKGEAVVPEVPKISDIRSIIKL